MKILFVCTGNICRSPLADAVLRHKVALAGLSEKIEVDSAGTHGYHVGERPDPRTLKIAAQMGVPTQGIYARHVKNEDFEDFDLILGMDSGHVRLLKQASPIHYHPKIHLFLEYSGVGIEDVADPYYGDLSDFSNCYDVVDAGIEKLMQKLKNLI